MPPARELRAGPMPLTVADLRGLARLRSDWVLVGRHAHDHKYDDRKPTPLPAGGRWVPSGGGRRLVALARVIGIGRQGRSA